MDETPAYVKEVVEKICAIVDSEDFEFNFEVKLREADGNDRMDYAVLEVIDRATSKPCFSTKVQRGGTLGSVYGKALFDVNLGDGNNLPKSSNNVSILHDYSKAIGSGYTPSCETYGKFLGIYNKLVSIYTQHKQAHEALERLATTDRLITEKTHCLRFLDRFIPKETSSMPGTPQTTCICNLQNGKFICLGLNSASCPVPQALQAEKDLYDAGYGAAGATVDPSKYDCGLCDAYLNYMAKNRQK